MRSERGGGFFKPMEGFIGFCIWEGRVVLFKFMDMIGILIVNCVFINLIINYVV